MRRPLPPLAIHARRKPAALAIRARLNAGRAIPVRPNAAAAIPVRPSAVVVIHAQAIELYPKVDGPVKSHFCCGVELSMIPAAPLLTRLWQS